MIPEAQRHLAKAERMIGAANALVIAGFPDVAVGRAYYGFLHAARAALAEAGISTYRHESTLRAFASWVRASSPATEKELVANFTAAQRIREATDYDPLANPSDDQARTQIQLARAFTEAIRAMLLA